jgi:acetyl-CoA carboxylase beta subunit
MIEKSITEAIDAISRVTDLFYQSKTEEGYKELEKVLIVLNNMVNVIAMEARNGVNILLDEGKLNEILTEAMKALEAGDTILFSDIFEYDLKDLLAQSVNTEN